MDIFEWDENTPVTANNLNEMQNTLNDNITNQIDSENGYIKYADGTMICYGKITTESTGYSSVTFPIAFIDAPVVTASQESGTETANIVCTKLSSITANGFRIGCVYSGGYVTQYAKWIAIGKWK